MIIVSFDHMETVLCKEAAHPTMCHEEHATGKANRSLLNNTGQLANLFKTTPPPPLHQQDLRLLLLVCLQPWNADNDISVQTF